MNQSILLLNSLVFYNEIYLDTNYTLWGGFPDRVTKVTFESLESLKWLLYEDCPLKMLFNPELGLNGVQEITP